MHSYPRKRLRILTIGHSYTVAINRAVARRVAECDDFEVTVAAPRFFHGDLRPLILEAEPADSKLRLVGLNARLTRWIHIFRYNDAELQALAVNGDFDIVHAWEEPYILAGCQIANVFEGGRAKHISWTAQNLVKRYPPPFTHFERTTIRQSAAWVACGELVYETALRRGYPAASGHVIPLGVELSAFHPLDARSRAEILARFNLKPPLIVYLGRLTEEKGIRTLQHALDRLPSSVPWSLLLLGSGPLEGAIRRWAADRHSDRSIRVMLARHDEVPQFLGAGDILVAPSQTAPHWREQFGRMIIEAFASGLAVIGSDSGEIPRVLGDAGLVIAEKDVEAWSRAITMLLQEPAVRNDLVQRGFRRVTRYSTMRVAEQWAALYRALAETKSLAAVS